MTTTTASTNVTRHARAARATGLCTTYEGHHPKLLERILPLVDAIEFCPDTIAELSLGRVRASASILAELRAASERVRLLAHGVGLSIGTHERASDAYMTLLDEVREHVDLAWHSEHLGYVYVDGEHLGTMLALPRTEEALELVCQRVRALQERVPLPFLLENVASLLPDPGGDYSLASFSNELCRRTGCGLLLDVYNLECDAHNHALEIERFLDELDLANVRELHVACGVERDGMWLDVHSRRTHAATRERAQEIVERAAGSVEFVTFEVLRSAVPVLGYDAIEDELALLRASYPGP